MKVSIDSRLEELTPLFIDKRKSELKDLANSIENRNFEKIELMGHYLAGMAPKFGLVELGLIGLKLEMDASRAEDAMMNYYLHEIAEYLENLEIEFIKLQEG